MYYIGIDIGGTGIQAGVVNEEGQIIYRNECVTDTNGGFEKIIEDINIMVRSMIEVNNISI